MITFAAPAKLNLTLEVLHRRPDGYHEIRSVMQATDLCDYIRFRQGKALTISSGSPQWEADRSLVSRAARLLKETSGYPGGASIEVEKHVPMTAGLGGDSSDAAATLKGLNQLWGLGLTRGRLLEMATRLGSDVPFFAAGGTALAEGRGEILTPLPPLPHLHIVLVVPDVPRPPEKTGQLYAILRPEHFTDGSITRRMADEIREGGGLNPSLLFNTFENVAFDVFPGLKVYRDHFRKLGAGNVHLCGSGPALFTLVKDRSRAEDLYTRCINQGMETYLAGTT